MSKNTVKQQAKKERRARRTRSRLLGTSARPRLSVNRSLKHISAQIIDDTTGKTLAASSDTVLETKGKKTDVAVAVGTDIAKKAQAAGVKTIVFEVSREK